MKTSKKVICLLLTLIMVVSSLPMVTFEAEAASSSLKTKYWGIAGDSTIFLYTNGSTKISAIVDTGNANSAAQKSGEKSFLDKLNSNKSNLKKENGKYVIDYVLLTHCHGDHISGLFDAIKTSQYYIKNLIVNSVYINNERETFKSDIKKAVNNKLIKNVLYVSAYKDKVVFKDVNNKEVKISGSWSLLGNVFPKCKVASDFNFTIFPAFKKYKNSNGDVGTSEENNSSMIIKFEYTKTGKETNYVFLGDLYYAGLKDICESADYNKYLSTDYTTYLKINHHASRRISFAPFSGNGLKKYIVNNNLYTLKTSNENTAAKKAKELSPKFYNYYFCYDGYYYVYTTKQGEKAFNQIKKCARIVNGKIVPGEYNINGTVVTNYDEKIKTLFSKKKLIGIGNVKEKDKLTTADVATYFAIEGCYEYVDTRKWFTKLSDVCWPDESTVASLYCCEETYTVNK